MVVEQVHLIDVQQAAVGLGQQARFKGPNPLAEGFFNVDRAAEAVFGGAQGQVHHRHLAAAFAEAFAALHPFAHLAALQVWIAGGAVVGISCHHRDLGQEIS